MGADIAAGYQAFDWGDAMAELALCWHATGTDAYAKRSLHYLDALLDDRYKVGDGQGGRDVVRHDSGYGIRTFALYAALGYDWLRHAPGMTPELRQRIVTRLDEWLGWYAEHGYLRDKPIANYFWGYFTALTMAGLAVGDDAVKGRQWLGRARDELLSKRVLPLFKAKLSGGDWPEGWQYGELVATGAALVARSYRTAAGVDVVAVFPWLREVVDHHTHALLPGGKSVYGGGTWAERPSKPSSLAMHAVSLALDGVDDRRAAQARYLARQLLPPLDRGWTWIALLADRPGAAEQDPRDPAKLSYYARGSGLTLMRSSWAPTAVFASFKVGPRLAADHQDKDDGHFELWRGSDGLLIDAGDSEGEATINHNTLLVDDRGRLLTYTPNQGVWGSTQNTRAVVDDGRVAAVVGEFSDSYAPKCAREGCSERAVERATRTLLFIRPALLVVEDRVTLDAKTDGVTWATHLRANPERAGTRTSARIGASRVDVDTLEPERASIVVLKEPTPSGEGPHRANRVFGSTWRLEVRSPKTSAERRFLHWISAGARDSAAPPVLRLRGEGLSGARGVIDAAPIAVLFARPGGKLSLGDTGPLSIVIAGLEPAAGYTVETRRTPSCEVEVKRGGALRANAAGVLRVEGCQ